MPGTKFPSVTVDSIAGSKINLDAPTEGMNRLIVVYRGQFCPFCQGEEFVIHKCLALFRPQLWLMEALVTLPFC
jgi:hypothetical protein